MSSRSSMRISVARHVYLRTQQRRLRHVKSVIIRNLTLSGTNADILRNPVAMETHFTIHPTHYPEKVLYKSYSIPKSYNPSWEAIQFNPQEYDKYSSIPSFIMRVWMKTARGSQLQLVFEKTIDLASLVYLGSLVNKDGCPYPPNSVVVGMYEGYYSSPGVGGVPCPPPINHGLEKLLPPQSLLEVNKLELRDSYSNPTLLRLIRAQEMQNSSITGATQAHNKVECLQKGEHEWFIKRRERELLIMRVAVLQSQLDENQREETEERNQLCRLEEELNTKEQTLNKSKTSLEHLKDQYKADYEKYCKKREMLVRAKRNQLLRQKNMISEAAFTFFIAEQKERFTICNVILPNSDQLDQTGNVEQPGVALGYVAHLVHHLAQILLVPLQYEIRPNGSRSYICDFISDEAIIDDIREFPLFLKGVERALFHYAVHLLNKDIAQIRQHCGYGMSKSMLKKTLPNLKYIVEKIISELSMQSISPSILDPFHSFLPSTPTHDSLPIFRPRAVPIGGMRGNRELDRLSSSSLSSPPTMVSLAAEQDVYGTSVSSSVSFQQSEEGNNSRSLSPIQPQSSQGSPASEQSFHSKFHSLETSEVANSSSIPYQYPTSMQRVIVEQHYPTNATKKPVHTVMPNVFPVIEDVSSNPHLSVVNDNEKIPELRVVSSQSYAHADLHRIQFMSLERSEEMASAGMNASTCDDVFANMELSLLPNSLIRETVTKQHVVDKGTAEYESRTQQSLSLLQTPSSLLGDYMQRKQTESRTFEEPARIGISHNHQTSNSQHECLNDGPFGDKNTLVSNSHLILDSASINRSLIEASYSKTLFATPHKVSIDESPDNKYSVSNSKHSNDSGFNQLKKNGSSVTGTDSETSLLEDFIDGF